MDRNDELSWLFTNRFMKVKKMGIVEIFRRIWLFSAKKMKSSESVSKQPSQLLVEHNSSLRQKSDIQIVVVRGNARRIPNGPNFSKTNFCSDLKRQQNYTVSI